jgi:hypothetical protein
MIDPPVIEIILTKNTEGLFFGIIDICKSTNRHPAQKCSQPIGACCMLSDQFQGFIAQKIAHFQDHILTLQTVHRCALRLGRSLDAEMGHNHVETATPT